jgi:hypothetical protein
MADSKDGFAEHVSAADSGPTGHVEQQRRSGRFQRHCARFWWLYALLVIVLTLVTVLPL